MSFKCDFCGLPVAQGIKPILVVLDSDRRQVSYVNEVELPQEEGSTRKPKTVTKVSNGTEFVAELKSCGPCQGIEAKLRPEVSNLTLITLIKGMQAYARKSNKRIDEDFIMQRNIETFKSIPLGALAVGLEDTKVVDKHVPGKMSYTIMENMSMRAHQADHTRNKKAKRDFIASFQVLNAYKQAGGTI